LQGDHVRVGGLDRSGETLGAGRVQLRLDTGEKLPSCPADLGQ